MREMIWTKERGFEGWRCSECGWVYRNPSGLGIDLAMMTRMEEIENLRRKVQTSFDEHGCAQYPKAHPTDS